jgi:hypothetical protein
MYAATGEHKTGNNTDALFSWEVLIYTADSSTWPSEPDKLSRGEESALNLIINAVTVILRFFIRI